jgi:hypothetical protein
MARSHEAGMAVPPEHLFHRWRRYLRFSLRGLIVVVLLFGIWLGWIARESQIQREAVAAMSKCDQSLGARPWAHPDH